MSAPSNLDLAAHPLVAGLLGGLVGLRFVPGLSWPERLTNLAAGGLLSYYTAPALVGWWGLSEQMLGFLGFLIGMFGLSVASAVLQAIRQLDLADVIRSWISRR